MLEHAAVAVLLAAVLGLALLVVLLAAAGLFVFRFRRIAISEREAAGLCRKAGVLSPPEAALFRVLDEAMGDSYRLFPKVRLCDVAPLKPGLRAWERWKAQGELSRRSVDFLLCDRKTFAPVFAVILAEPKAEADALLEGALRGAGVRVVKVAPRPAYDVRELRDKLGASYASLP